MNKKNIIEKLTNKFPTKDISEDDLKYKIPLVTQKKKKLLKLTKK